MKKKFNVLNVFIIFMFLISALVFVNGAFYSGGSSLDLQINAQSQIAEDEIVLPQIKVDSVVENATMYTKPNLTNNLVLVNFKNETKDYTLYKDSYTTFNTMFNTGAVSIKEYYDTVSNGKLNFETDVITTNGTDALIVTLDKERTYYMPYVIIDEVNGSTKYTYNPDGYFDYYLVSGTSSYSSYYPQFYRDYTLIAKVYDNAGTGLPADSDYSDKIMTYNEAVTLANSKGYQVVESQERYLREYQLICNAIEKSSSYMNTANSDYDNNFKFDCFSLGLIDNARVGKYNMDSGYYWSSLLWPHKVEGLGSMMPLIYSFYIKSLGESNCVGYFQKFGFSTSDIQTIIGYMKNQPKANGLSFDVINVANYEVFDLATQAKWQYFVEDITTACHELGHVLGLPDLYRYDNNSSDSVGSWSHMCQSHTTYPSFFTSYERAKFNWIDYDNNIKTLTQEGIYTLNAVKGDDGTNTIAYRIADPNNANQFVYLEYRGQTHEYYDNYCGANPGLIAYTVRTNVVDGNKEAPPYEIYVHRPSGKTVYYASIGEGQSIGNSNTASTANAILFDIEISGVGTNSGIVVEVLGQTEDQLIIKITAPSLYSATPYTADDLGGNTVLYNKLLSQSSNGTLLYDSFTNTTTLDLSYCNISDLLFLSMFTFKSLKYLNLIGNYFTATFDFASVVSTYSLQNVNLNFNIINLKNLSQSYLTNTIYDWGVQYTSKNKVFVNTSCSFLYYFTSLNTISSISVNNVAVDVCESGQVKEHTLYSNGENSIKVAFRTNNLGLSTITGSLIIAKATSLYDTTINSYKLAKGDSFPNVNSLIKIEGYDISNFEIMCTFPSTDSQKNGYFTVFIAYDKTILATVIVHYSVIEITVEFGADSPVILEIGESYIEKGIRVRENGVNKNYQQLASGNCTYIIKYYYGTIEQDGTVNLGNECTISSSQKANYLVNYIITTSFGKKYSNYYLEVVVDDDLIKPSKMNSRLYSVLLGISEKEFVYKADFAGLDYLDLASKNLENINGLELLDFKSGVVVDLTNNNLSDISEVITLTNDNTEIASVYLLFNNYKAADIVGLSNRSKYCFAMQNIKTVNLTTAQNVAVADFYNDYGMAFNFDCQNYNIQDNKLYFDTTGSFSCNFTNSTIRKTYSKIIQYIIINPKEQSTKEYSDTLEFAASNFFTIQGKDFGSLSVSSNFNSLELNKLGEKVLEAEFAYNGATLKLSHSIMVVDTVKPVISLSGNLTVYVTSLDQYKQLYGNDAYYAADAYDGELSVSVEIPEMKEYGLHHILYSATDSSGNQKILTRKVYMGNVEFTKTQSSEGYGIPFELPLKFYGFTQDQFSISYKIEGESSFKTYSSSNLITISEFKQAKIYVRVVHVVNTNIFKTYEYNVNVIDTLKPHVEVLGDSVLEMYAGETFIDSGVKITDNGTNDIVTLQNTSTHVSLDIEYKFKPMGENEYKAVQDIDMSVPGEYIIKYIATDRYNNVEFGTRTIQIEYGPIDSIEIDQSRLLTKQSKGNKVVLKLNCISEYITEPNPTVLWFVNEKLYKETNGTSVEIELNEVGEVLVYAQLKGSDTIYSQDLIFTVYQQSPFEGAMLYVVIAIVVVAVVLIVIGAISRYRKRNFY